MGQSTRNTTTSTPQLISVHEVAEMLSISERTVWRLLSAGKIPEPIRFGRNVRWQLSRIQQWIDEGCPETM